MSFFDTIINAGKSILGGSNSLGSTILTTVLSGFALNKLNKQVTKENETPKTTSGFGLPTIPWKDPGVREQVTANQKNKIPVIYGSAQLGGIIVDAEMSNSNKTMHYALAICEKTGTKLSDSTASSFTLEDVWWNDQKVVFKGDGYTIDYTVDRDNNRDYSLQDLAKIYFFNGDSQSGTNTSSNAYDIMPSWTSNHMMNDTVFAMIEVNYSKEKSVKGLGNVRFHVTNSMTLPGDCMYDYMTNTKYGAGIESVRINGG